MDKGAREHERVARKADLNEHTYISAMTFLANKPEPGALYRYSTCAAGVLGPSPSPGQYQR
ncbi:hypothetical protein BDW74DRAFT_162324 [Aspergillus multicolor]|uniref:uncharacterized protein n=1 Tax=Aspergillus multicolor TaxID=41759 RepID=UPI003CCE5348